MNHLLSAISTIVLLALTGCSTLLNTTQEPTSNDSTQTVSSHSAVQNLYASSMQNRMDGKVNLAEANLERALRLEPENPQLWFELAQCAHIKGEQKKAQELASKAASLAGNNPALKRKINAFIHQIKE